MPLIPADRRLSMLERLGLSPRLLDLARGRDVPARLAWRCRPIRKVYEDGDDFLGEYAPDGPTTLPLWESGTVITAVRRDADGLAFFAYDLEDHPFVVEVLARTERGFWGRLFADLIEAGRGPLDDLARDLGFRDLSLVEERYRAGPHATFEQHEAFLRALSAELDAAEGRAP